MSDTNSASPASTKRMRGPNKPVQGKFEIEFLKETAAPERKPLVGGGGSGPRDTVLSDTLKKLKEHPGKLAVIFISPAAQEVYTRRVSLLNAADRLGIELDEKNTASREFEKDGVKQKDADGNQLYALYAMAK